MSACRCSMRYTQRMRPVVRQRRPKGETLSARSAAMLPYRTRSDLKCARCEFRVSSTAACLRRSAMPTRYNAQNSVIPAETARRRSGDENRNGIFSAAEYVLPLFRSSPEWRELIARSAMVSARGRRNLPQTETRAVKRTRTAAFCVRHQIAI